MKACALAGMLVLALDDVSAAALADPDPLSIAPAAAATAAPAKPGFPVSDDAIRKAVRESLAQEPRATLKPDGAVLRGGRYQAFSRQFSEAQKPSCLGPDALKHQPHSMVIGGWNVGVGGLLTLPFWGAAAVRGKCL